MYFQKKTYQSPEAKPRYTLTSLLVRGSLGGLVGIIVNESWTFLMFDVVNEPIAPWSRYTLDACYGAMGFLAGMCTDKNV